MCPPTLTRGVILALDDFIFIGSDLLDDQLNNLPEALKVLDSEQVIFRGIRGYLYHLVNAIDVRSNCNHENVHSHVFECFGFGYGQLFLDIRLAISNKKNHLPREGTYTFKNEKYCLNYNKDYSGNQCMVRDQEGVRLRMKSTLV